MVEDIGRRRFICLLGQSAVAVGITANKLILPTQATPFHKNLWGGAIKNPKNSHNMEKVLKMYNTHTGEVFKRAYWEKGKFDKKILKEIEHFFRDHRTGTAHPIDRNLLHLINILTQKTESTELVHLCSGFRSEQTNKMLRARSTKVATNSLHKQGKAADIFIPEIGNKKLAKLAWNLQKGGVGCYSDFIHIDTGKTRRWGTSF